MAEHLIHYARWKKQSKAHTHSIDFQLTTKEYIIEREGECQYQLNVRKKELIFKKSNSSFSRNIINVAPNENIILLRVVFRELKIKRQKMWR